MSKYLYITGGSDYADYAAATFEQDFDGSRLGLWTLANAAGHALDYDNDDLYFGYEAMELDDATVKKMQEHMDYDGSKHANYFKVDE